MRALAVLVFATVAGPAWADSATAIGANGVAADSGAAIYQHVCQGCHMPEGRGAVGAGAFPKLAGDPKLENIGYPVSRVLEGHGGMPWFNGILKPQQIADVVNYVRSHFGNHYTDTITAAEVAAAAGPAPVMER